MRNLLLVSVKQLRSRNQHRVRIVAQDYPSNLLSYAEHVNRKDVKNPWSTEIFPVDALLYRRTIRLLAQCYYAHSWIILRPRRRAKTSTQADGCEPCASIILHIELTSSLRIGRSLRGTRSVGIRSRLTANDTNAPMLICLSVLFAQLNQLCFRPHSSPNSYWLWTRPIVLTVSYIDWRNSLLLMCVFIK